MTSSPTDQGNPSEGIPVNSTVPFEGINSPGAYVLPSGHLLRVPSDSIAAGRSPLMSIEAKEPLLVTKISDDPNITKAKARQVCANADIAPNF